MNYPQERRTFLVLLVLLGIFFLYLLKPVFISVLFACIVSIILYPVYSFFLKKFKDRRYLASFVTTLLMFLVLVLPFSYLAVQIVNQIIDVLPRENLRDAFSFLTTPGLYQTYIQPVIASFEERFSISIDVIGLMTKLVKEIVRYAYNYSPQVVGLTASFIFQFFVMHVTVFFLFIEGRKVTQILLDLSPLRQKHEKRLTKEFQNMIYATVHGYLVTALVQGILAGVGFSIAGVPAPLIFGTLTFFMSMVPIVGATSIWLPIGLIYLIQGNVGWGLFILLYGALVISGIDNFLKPWIMKSRAKIHILLIFFSLLGGITLMGPIGILVGPVATAMFLACIRIYREDFIKA